VTTGGGSSPLGGLYAFNHHSPIETICWPLDADRVRGRLVLGDFGMRARAVSDLLPDSSVPAGSADLEIPVQDAALVLGARVRPGAPGPPAPAAWRSPGRAGANGDIEVRVTCPVDSRH